MSHDPSVLPEGLPVPVDDGGAAHLPGHAMSALALPTNGALAAAAAAAGGASTSAS